jgi:GTP cyclohydrolase IA
LTLRSGQTPNSVIIYVMENCAFSTGSIAETKVLGLSKFARIAHQCAHRLQLQERLTHQIASEVTRITQPTDVVVGEGEHTCMRMRGIISPARMVSSVVRGRFCDLPALTAEAIALMV